MSTNNLDDLVGQVIKNNTKFLVVCGGVASGIGKGITISSIASLFQKCNFRVSLIKIDPYLNQDAGTMSPFEHGECYILNDGGEVDLDLGNYERFLEVNFTQHHNITSGKIYHEVITRERAGAYLGQTVQFIPHVTDMIKEKILKVSQIPIDGSDKPPEICLIEVGGTVGDQESTFFYESIRQLKHYLKRQVFVVLVTYVIKIKDEFKTKPTQNAIRQINQLGLKPDMIILRSEDQIDSGPVKKVAMYGDLEESCVYNIPNKTSLFEVPLLLQQNVVVQVLQQIMGLPIRISDAYVYTSFLKYMKSIENLEPIKICFVGKYVSYKDAYMSIIKAFEIAALAEGKNHQIEFIESILLEDDYAGNDETKKLESEEAWKKLKECGGIFIPGGYGNRGFRGKIKAAQFARENKKPILGVCFGFQAMAIEFAINVLGITDAYSEEHADKFPSKNHIIMLLPDTSLEVLGGTMRVGAKTTFIKNKESLAYKLYGKDQIQERHRHRYEFNVEYLERFQDKGMKFTGVDESGKRYSILELENHPFFFGTQFHPEFNNKYTKPCPTYCAFLSAIAGTLDQKLKDGNGTFAMSLKHIFPDSKKNEKFSIK